MNKAKALKDFQNIPGIGPSIAKDLWKIGIQSLNDLMAKIPN